MTSIPKTLFFALIIATFVGNSFAQDNDKSKRTKITISRQTTYVTEYLRPDGSPDYATFLNEKHSKGVTAENNLMVGLVHTMPELEDSEDYNREFCRLLGIERPDPNKKYFSFYSVCYRDELKDNVDAMMAADDQLTTISRHPWDIRKHKYPRIWIEENREIVDRFVVYINKAEKLHSPIINWSNTGPEIHFFDRRVTRIGAIAHYLRVRSMQKFFEGDIDGAESDLLACRKIAKLLYESNRLYYAIYPASDALEQAIEGEFQLCMSPNYTAKRLAEYRDKASKIKIKREIRLPIDWDLRFERIIQVFMARKDEADLFSQDFLSETAAAKVKDVMDWNALLVRFNTEVDKRIETLNGDPSNMRGWSGKELDSIGIDFFDSELDILQKRLALRGGGPKDKADMVAALFVNDYMQSLKNLCEYHEICQTRQEVADVAMAICQFKLEHGAYPENLNALTPAYLDEIPKDRFSGNKLIYKRTGDHFMLYSVGYDRQDSYKFWKEFGRDAYNHLFMADIGFHSDPSIWGDIELNQ